MVVRMNNQQAHVPTRLQVVLRKDMFSPLKIHKVDEAGQPLQGAVFEVIRDRNQAVVGRLTTDSDGNASVGKLLRDNYTIREVTAPLGYDKLTEDIKISPDEFGSDKSVRTSN